MVLGLLALFKSAAGRAGLDRAMLKLPVVADVVRYAIVERVCRILSLKGL